MLCSICKKNTAVIFINKIEDGKNSVEGLCYNCAKEKGINPLEVLAKQSNLSEDELNDMSSQLENIFNDITENISGTDGDDMQSIGPLLGNIFGINKKNDDNSDSAEPSSERAAGSQERKKVKTEKRPKEKKKRFLDSFGTNLTEKAKQGKLDRVIGRNKEIQRISNLTAV